jgi:hypothetical protein
MGNDTSISAEITFEPPCLLILATFIVGGFIKLQLETVPVKLQVHPASIRQFDEQPSPPIELPSSH